MDDAKTTWALVVGIDDYDNTGIPRLQGAAADAVAAVGWLRKLGVPGEQILLHLAPSAATKPSADALGLPFGDGRKASIVASIGKLRKVRGGTRLFVFLSGHGLYEPVGKRLFLPQDAGVDDIWVNFALDRYCDLFRSMAFRRQFLVMDGCLNYPQDPSRKPTIEAEGFPGLPDPLPDPNVGLAACYAASQAQRAVELGGRGVFLRRLLAALDPDQPLLDGVDLDLGTGVRMIDLRKLVQEVIVREVADEVFAATRLVQTPQFEALGATQSLARVAVCRLPDQPTVEVLLTVEPPAAAADITEVRVALRDPPYADYSVKVPPAPSITVPVAVHLPVGTDAWARCQLPAAAPWDVVRRDVDLPQVRSAGTYSFELSPRPPQDAGGPPGPAGEEVFSVRTLSPAGESIPAMDYPAAAARLGLDRVPADGEEIAAGVRFEQHEIGPDFRVEAGAHAVGAELAARWAGAASAASPPDTAVEMTVRGSVAPEDPPNLRVRGPLGGPAALAGALADRAVLWVGAPGAADGGQLLRLPEGPDGVVLRMPPGPFQVRLSLPWGSWTHSGFVPAAGEAVVELPATIGATPLRVTLHGAVRRDRSLAGSGWIVGASGTSPRGRLLRGLRDRGGIGLTRRDVGGVAWALAAAEPLTAPGVAVLDGTSEVRFPLLPDRAVAVERIGATVRVEPLSDVDAPEWDLLVAVGGLDTLSADQAVELTNQKWFDPLLGLAGAYAVWAGANWPYLRIVLGNLWALPTGGPDVDLLDAALRRAETGTLAAPTLERLAGHARSGAVPLFRWGVPLALDLLGGALRTAADDPAHGRAGARAGARADGGLDDLAAWHAALSDVNARLAATSVWTAWAA